MDSETMEIYVLFDGHTDSEIGKKENAVFKILAVEKNLPLKIVAKFLDAKKDLISDEEKKSINPTTAVLYKSYEAAINGTDDIIANPIPWNSNINEFINKDIEGCCLFYKEEESAA